MTEQLDFLGLLRTTPLPTSRQATAAAIQRQAAQPVIAAVPAQPGTPLADVRARWLAALNEREEVHA